MKFSHLMIDKSNFTKIFCIIWLIYIAFKFLWIIYLYPVRRNVVTSSKHLKTLFYVTLILKDFIVYDDYNFVLDVSLYDILWVILPNTLFFLMTDIFQSQSVFFSSTNIFCSNFGFSLIIFVTWTFSTDKLIFHAKF